MKILAFETATYFGGVAYVDGNVRESIGPFAPRESSREVLTAANRLLEKNGIRPEQLDLIAVSTGPGLFTGVRVGMSIAKTLVWSGNKGSAPALVSVPTLDAVASLVLEGGRCEPGDTIVAITDARRGEVYACAFTAKVADDEGSERAIIIRLGEDIVVRPDRLGERLPVNTRQEAAASSQVWIVGDGYDRYGELVHDQFPEARIFPHALENLAIRVAALGREIFERAGGESPEKVQPHYVRRPDARLPVGPFLAAKDNDR